MLLQTKTLNDTAPPFLTNEELNQLLLPIIDPQYKVNKRLVILCKTK